MVPGVVVYADTEAPESVQGGGVDIIASAAPTRLTIGDRILYTLHVKTSGGVSVTFPAVGKTLGEFYITDMGGTAQGDKGQGESRAYALQIFEAGDHVIPSMVLVARYADGSMKEFKTGEIAVRVESLLGDDATDIKDIKPPFSVPYFPAWLVVWGIVAAVVVAAVIVFIVRRRRSAGAAPPPPPLPPHLIAYEELRKIKALNLVVQGRLKEYYSCLADIVRRYTERRFGLRAPEMTTEEFLGGATESGLLDARARTLVGDFLEQCDLVKFAKYGPTDSEIEGAYGAAKRFVDETKSDVQTDKKREEAPN
jgi:hypothetical protein